MASWRIVTAAALGAVLLTACGEEALVAAEGTSSTLAGADRTIVPFPDLTTTAEWAPITFTLGIADDGARLRIRPGDEVVTRLPLTGLSDLGWILLIPPNPAVLGGGDDLLWRPSEIDQGGVAFHEFNFMAAGPGETTVILIHGWQEFTFTVLVAAHQ